MRKIKEIRELSATDLKQRIADKVEELANLKLQLALKQLDNTAKVRLTRRELARMKTLLKEHELGLRPITGAEAQRV
jgi:large subunit ribosomal protein L29